MGHKVIHASFGGNGSGGQRVVTGDHHGANTHFPQLSKSLFEATFDDMLELHNSENFVSFSNNERCLSLLGYVFNS